MSLTAPTNAAVVLTLVLVVSVFAGTASFTGTAEATVTSVTAEGATDVQAYRTAATQTVTATVVLVDGSAETTVTVDVDGGNLVGVDSATADNRDVRVSDVTVDSPTRVTVDLADTTAGDGTQETAVLTLTVTHNLATVESASNLDVTVRSAGHTDTTRFDVVRYRGPSGPVGRVFLGDQNVDLTRVRDVPQAGSATLVGVGGAATGTVVTVGDVTRASVTAESGFTVGGYSLAGVGPLDLSVVEPRITDVTLFVGEGTGGSDVTNRAVPQSIDTLTLDVAFSFADAEDVEVVVRDASGLHITTQLTETDRISRSGGALTLDVAGLDVGTYRVIVTGADDLDHVRRVVRFEVRETVQTVSLSQSRVVAGEDVVARVVGTPGQFGLLRVPASDIEGRDATDSAARRVFEATGDVVTRRGTESLGVRDSEAFVGAVVDLGDDGVAQVRLDTNAMRTRAVDVTFVELTETNTRSSTLRQGFDAPAADETLLRVDERTLLLSDGVTTLRIGERATFRGTAPQSETVKAFARVGTEWVPLRDDDGRLAESEVDRNGRFSIDVDSGTVLDLPGWYRIAVVADPSLDGQSSLGSTAPVPADVFSEFTTADTTTVRMLDGGLTAVSSTSEIAANVGDELTISGTAFGQGDSVRIYLVGPRGQYLDSDGAFGAESVDVRDNEFDLEYDAFEQHGVYRFVVVGHGRDGRYASDFGFQDVSFRRGLTSTQARALVHDAYTGAGVDDRVTELTVRAAPPMLSVDPVGEDGTLSPRELTLSGTSNRVDGTLVSLKVVDAVGRVVAVDEAEVDAQTWRATVDLSDVTPGRYTVRATDDEVSTSRSFRAVPAGNDPAETPVETPAETPRPEVTPAPRLSQPTTGTATAVGPVVPANPVPRTTTEFPGFGVVGTLGALVVAFLVVLSRRRR